MSVVRDLLQWTVIVCLGYVVAVYGAYGAMITYSMLEERLRRRRRIFESLDRVRASTLTIPVSIIAPVYNEAPVVAASTRSFLEIDYPEYEVIVVNDGSTDDTLAVLQREFELEPIEHFYRRRYESGPIRGLYRSRTHPKLVVIDKVNGGKADSLNCGLNLARYRYICGVDGDTILSHTCLLNGMRLALADPQRIVGVTGHIAISSRPEEALAKDGEPAKLDSRPLLVFQHCDYLRSFFNNRLGWTRLNTMLCAVGAFQIWRSDVIEEIGGFSTTFTCEDIELTFRVHEHFRRQGKPVRDRCARRHRRRDGRARTRSASSIAQRERWQRVILETVVSYRRMMFRRRYGTVGFIGVPFFVLSEVIAPVFELLALLALVASVAAAARSSSSRRCSRSSRSR